MRLVERPEANGAVPRARADSGRNWEFRPEERWSQDCGPQYQGLGVFSSLEDFPNMKCNLLKNVL